MVDHGARDHATWSASSTARNWNCAGAIALASQVEHLDIESEAAAWGTACHQLSEKCLRQNKDAADFIDTIEKTKRFEFEVDEEMAATAQEYVDYVRERMAAYKAETGDDPILHIEQKFSLKKLNPPFDAGGTGDATLIFIKWRLLESIDLKGGRGVVVEVNENKQTRTYALGAMLMFPGLDIQNVMSTIVQPRAQHKDGRIRSETYHVTELAEWTADLVAAMQRAAQACADYEKITGELSREAWADTHLKAGDHCTFCPAGGFCPALEKKALDAAGVWFTDEGEPQLRNSPSDLDPARLAQTLDAADLITGYLNACRALATRLAETGTEIAGPNGKYQLVEKIGNRRFKDPQKAREVLFLHADLTDDEMFNAPKLKSPAQIEKTLGAKRLRAIKEQFDELIERPVTGTSLVRADKTSKKPKASTVNQFLNAID